MKKGLNILIIGFALFSMFFGAGNLIFPPYLGISSGSEWLNSFTGFVIGDVGLALIIMVIMAKHNGSLSEVTMKMGKKFSVIIGIVIITCLGPLLAIPRTAATTFEVGVQGIFPNANPIISSIIFFAITLMLTIKPSKVIDIVGEFLTPTLLICLIILITKGIMNPIGEFTSSRITDVFSTGLAQGYQTMDALGSLMFAVIIMESISKKGYTDKREIVKMTFYSGIVAAIGLVLVYAGLAYIGAHSASVYDTSIPQTQLIISITASILGEGGKIVLGLIVALACLTTSIGLTSATANFYEKLFKGKFSYSKIVVIICVFSAFVSNFGVSTIIQFSAPILELIYPVSIVLVVMNAFDNKIKKKSTYAGAVYTTLVISIFNLMAQHGYTVSFLKYLPLNSIGFNWILPAIIGGIIGSMIKVRSV